MSTVGVYAERVRGEDRDGRSNAGVAGGAEAVNRGGSPSFNQIKPVPPWRQGELDRLFVQHVGLVVVDDQQPAFRGAVSMTVRGGASGPGHPL